MSQINLAPIVLFVYNRPWHTQQTIEALQRNELADESELFIYSDGPRDDKARESVRRVREYVKTINNGFKKITIIERDRNWGLADSIIDGVTEVVNEYGRVIVLEDDLVTSPFFLRYMNEALEYYKDNEKVMHIAGYFPSTQTQGLSETFFIRPTSCWGWATWERAWKHFEKNTDKLMKVFTKDMIFDFNMENSYDYYSHILMNKTGKLDTWAIYWYATIFLLGGLSLHPKASFVKNIGHDGSGEHCGKNISFDIEIVNNYYITKFSSKIEESALARKALKEYYLSLQGPLWKRIINELLRLTR